MMGKLRILYVDGIPVLSQHFKWIKCCDILHNWHLKCIILLQKIERCSVMYRKVYEQLKKWKKSNARKPLIIYGARQIGKTYSMLEFGQEEYDNVAYFNLENNSDLVCIFDKDLNPERIIAELSILKSVSIIPERTLIIFDEIQACEKALTFLKYINEDANEYHIIAAGSLLGLALNRGNYSFPVGKVDTINMYPMTFEEFLIALGEEELKNVIIKAAKDTIPLSETMHNKALELYRTYLAVGGYPEAVVRYIEKRDFDYVRAVQCNISDAYIADMAKYSTPADMVKAIAAYNSLPSQLAKENSKFMYSVIGSSARAKDYESAISWLISAGVVIKCNKVTEGNMPLKIYEDILSFKMYYSDVGLLAMKSGVPAENIIHNLKLSDKMRGILAENYVAQELYAKGIMPYYWVSTNQAEVDFVIQTGDSVIPIEVKSADNVRARSLGIYRNKYTPEYSVRVSAKNFGFENGIKSIPLYALFAI